jgi:hypothetical protein
MYTHNSVILEAGEKNEKQTTEFGVVLNVYAPDLSLVGRTFTEPSLPS